MTSLSAPTRTARDMQLSLIAYQVGQLLADAAELYGRPRPEKPNDNGEMLVRLQDASISDKCGKAAAAVVDARVKQALDNVMETWEDHSKADFLRMRLSEILTELSDCGEQAPVAFFMAARNPERFCACGVPLMSSMSLTAGNCPRCASELERV